jgi:hypothetical protein
LVRKWKPPGESLRTRFIREEGDEVLAANSLQKNFVEKHR